MNRIELKSYAKINLCLDVKGLLPGGFHEIHMILQQILLHDDVAIRWTEGGAEERIRISIGTNRSYLPTDRRNLAWRAAELMINEYGGERSGEIRIDIRKRIPVAAGLGAAATLRK